MVVSAKTYLGTAIAVTVIVAAVVYPKSFKKGANSGRLTGVFEQQTVRVISRAGGEVVEVSAREGDRVDAGRILLRLEDKELFARYHRMQELRTRFDAAKKTAALIESLPPGYLQQFVEMNPEVRSAENEYVSALASSEQSKTPESAQSLRAAARRRETSRLEAARSGREAISTTGNLADGWNEGLQAMEAALEGAQVKAPAGGTLEILQLRPGDLIAPGQPVAAIALDGRFYVDLSISPIQLGLFHEGQTVRVRIGPTIQCSGVVQHVARTPDEAALAINAGPSFAVHIDVTQPPPEARAGMQAEVTPWQ